MTILGSPLLSLVQQAQTDLGLPLSSYVIRATDNTSRQMGGLATRVGQRMMRSRDWSFLTREFHIQVPAPIQTTGNLIAGSFNITGLPAGIAAQLLPGQMTVSGGTAATGAQTAGILQSTRLLSVSGSTATMDQPASVTGATLPIAFRQDSFPVPADFIRAINDTQWDATMRWTLRGPQTPQEAQWVRRGIVSTGPRRFYREIGAYGAPGSQAQAPTRSYRIWPPPSGSADSPAHLTAEYISNSWVWSSGGVGQSVFLADSDQSVFADHLMVLGLKAMFWQIKGFAADDMMDEWMRELRTAEAWDAGAQKLEMTRGAMFPSLISPANVPDASWPTGTP